MQANNKTYVPGVHIHPMVRKAYYLHIPPKVTMEYLSKLTIEYLDSTYPEYRLIHPTLVGITLNKLVSSFNTLNRIGFPRASPMERTLPLQSPSQPAEMIKKLEQWS